MQNYERLFGEKPREVLTLLEPKDHPELDSTPFCSTVDVAKYQSLIGGLQWCISLCHFDMTMSRFGAAPPEGHLQCVK